jgi:hypothetical protein
MGRRDKSATRKASLITLGFVVGLLAAALLPSPAVADDPPSPTNLQFESVGVFRHLIEEGDFLLVFHYNIYYESDQPDIPANKLFTFRLLDTNGIDYLGAIVPYAYHNSGYDQGCGSFYFSADDAPDWEMAYVMRISGNPEYFSSPPLVSRTLAYSNYSQLDTQEENQALLGEYVIEIAQELEINWVDEEDLTFADETGIMLSATGAAYFKGAITGLQAMAPQIFSTRTVSPEYPETEWEEAKRTEYEERFLDSWPGRAIGSVADLLGVKYNVVTGVGIFIAIIVVAALCQWRFGNAKPAPIVGICFTLAGTVSGWWSPAIMAIMAIFIGGLFLGYVWLFRHG